MCGISGFISKRRITLEDLTAMNDTMYHRGPNDSGVEIYDGAGGYAVGFAQRRLSIMDLSPLGHQPMHAADKRVSVVFNGEIYNFQELKKEFSGYPFFSQCDTEVILAAYEKWGIDCVSRFNGMFAIALYDRDAQEVYLVRDRIGKKPLYYCTAINVSKITILHTITTGSSHIIMPSNIIMIVITAKEQIAISGILSSSSCLFNFWFVSVPIPFPLSVSLFLNYIIDFMQKIGYNLTVA